MRPKPLPGKFADLPKQLALYYEIYGEGEPLLLLHGFGGCIKNWEAFVPDLALHYKLILLDLRGHGHSNNPGKQFTHREAATDILAFLDYLNIAQCDAMGMSSGGMVLLHLANQWPQRLKNMVLISAAAYFPAEARAIIRRASFETMPAEVIEMYKQCASGGEEQIRELLAQFNAFHENHTDMNLSAQELANIPTRTLLVQGMKDHFFSNQMASELCEALPNATLWMIPKGEHVPVFNPAIPFTQTALEFLKNQNFQLMPHS